MALNRDLKFSIILDNIRSVENVGAIFRTADVLGIDKIYLAGVSGISFSGQEKVLHPKIQKTALGAQNFIPWEHWENIEKLVDGLKKQNINIVCLENNVPQAKNILEFEPRFPLALIAGNEVEGIGKNILEKADAIIQIPMFGRKESFNVATAAGIAGFEINKYRIG